MRRIDEDEFGFCLAFGEENSIKQLQIDPCVTLCVNFQRRVDFKRIVLAFLNCNSVREVNSLRDVNVLVRIGNNPLASICITKDGPQKLGKDFIR